MGIFSKRTQADDRLESGLAKTRESFLKKISRLVTGKSKIDSDVLDELEEILISSDVGIATTMKIIERVEKRVLRDRYTTLEELQHILQEEIMSMLIENGSQTDAGFFASELPRPYVILVVGVNGVGKTTTIGKLAYQFRQAGKSVILGAGDTFRAAAIEQLSVWANRAGAELIRQQMGADPASVAYDTLSAAMARHIDVAIIDTAGRLHNKIGLMNELTKIKNVMQKVVPGAPHEILLVLDASTGQNAFEQAKHFTAATEVNAIALTKLDGTAKGGVVIGISDQFKVPIKYIGVGEKIDDLQIFNKQAFVQSLFKQ